MLARVKSSLSFANVVSVVALFVALGGTVYAAHKIDGRAIRRSSVPGNRLKGNSVIGKQVKESSLKTVPQAALADTVAAPENLRLVGAPGEPEFANGTFSVGGPFQPVAFYKDREGIVHLVGRVGGAQSNNKIFQLPPGYRPSAELGARFAVSCDCGGEPVGEVNVEGTSGKPTFDGAVIVGNSIPTSGIDLDGISFRAGS